MGYADTDLGEATCSKHTTEGISQEDKEEVKNVFRAQIQRFNYSKDPTMDPSLRKHRSQSKEADSDGSNTLLNTDTIEISVTQEPSHGLESDGGLGKNEKRKSAVSEATETQPAKRARVAKPTSLPVTVATNNLKDSIREGLILISIGLNPGIKTGETGHAYAHPTNRYWPTLHQSGIIPIQHHPRETHDLMDMYGLGHTNIIAHIASKDGSSLTTQDYADGSKMLEEKIRKCKPEAVALVGKGIFEEWFRYKKGRKFKPKSDNFEYGWQDESLWVGREEGGWQGARTFVVTTTSGLSAQYNQEQRVAIWKPLGDWFTPKREMWVKEQAGGTT